MKINLSSLKKEYELYDGKREKLIKQSRDVLKAAKQLIYAIHRGSLSECDKYKKELSRVFTTLLIISKKDKRLTFEGSFNEACEEYAEGMLYYDYIFEQKLRKPSELHITNEQYLGALSDVTGELGRKAVQFAIKKETNKIYEIQEFVSSVYKEMMAISFRNSGLRKKSDAIKWNLNKIEDILYDIEMKSK